MNITFNKRINKVAKTGNKQIKIKLTRGLVGTTETQRKVIKALGITKKDQVVEHYDSPTILGMVNKVSHLVQIVD